MLFHLAHLAEEVLEVEALGHLLFEDGGLGGVELLLGLFDEGDDVAHAEDAAGDAVGVEFLEGIELLADADELDGLARDHLGRQGGTAARVGVEFGQDQAVELQPFVEAGGGV